MGYAKSNAGTGDAGETTFYIPGDPADPILRALTPFRFTGRTTGPSYFCVVVGLVVVPLLVFLGLVALLTFIDRTLVSLPNKGEAWPLMPAHYGLVGTLGFYTLGYMLPAWVRRLRQSCLSIRIGLVSWVPAVALLINMDGHVGGVAIHLYLVPAFLAAFAFIPSRGD